MLIKLVPNKDKNHYHYKIFSKCSYQLAKKYSQKLFYTTIMVKIGKTEIAKDSYSYNNIVKTKTNSKYSIEYLDKDIRPLVLIRPTMSGCVKAFKVEDKNNKLMSFRVDDN